MRYKLTAEHIAAIALLEDGPIQPIPLKPYRPWRAVSQEEHERFKAEVERMQGGRDEGTGEIVDPGAL